MIEPETVIVCVDCGGRAHLLSRPRTDEEDPTLERWEPGDIATYRCEDCLDRWDLVIPDEGDEDGGAGI